MTVPTLYLIRHGETEWSASGRHTGRTDLPLTGHGRDQARGLAAWLGGIRFAQVLTSPRNRAMQTCALAGLGHQARVEPDLAEWDYGDYEGGLTVDIMRQRPGWSVFRDGCPGGEMPEQVSARADRLIARLLPLAGPIALFSHGQFSCVLAVRWIGLAVAEGRHFSFAPAAVSVLGASLHCPDTSVISSWNAVPGGLTAAPASLPLSPAAWASGRSVDTHSPPS
jgi:probable phosphoglycerate mutase